MDPERVRRKWKAVNVSRCEHQSAAARRRREGTSCGERERERAIQRVRRSTRTSPASFTSTFPLCCCSRCCCCDATTAAYITAFHGVRTCEANLGAQRLKLPIRPGSQNKFKKFCDRNVDSFVHHTCTCRGGTTFGLATLAIADSVHARARDLARTACATKRGGFGFRD